MTGTEQLHHPPPHNELFLHILSEMDEFEKKRQHRDSSSSVDSFVLSNGGPVKEKTEREEWRSMGVGRPSRPSSDASREVVEDRTSHKIVGRLRALTGGQREKGTPYTGT